MYATILVLCILQMVLPTVLGWLLLFALLLAYGFLIALSLPFRDLVVFMLVGFGPMLALWVGRPWANVVAQGTGGDAPR